MRRRSLNKLNKQLAELEVRISDLDVKTDSVSSAKVGWHIEHSFLVMNGIIRTMQASDPSKFKRAINFPKLYIFAIRRFPRGKSKSPKSVDPIGSIDENRLTEHLERTLVNVKHLSTLNDKAFYHHPGFGRLKRRDSIHFLELHTEHHLKIIRGIRTRI